MEAKKYRQIRVVVSMFVGMVVAMGVTRESYLLALAGVLTGMVFMGLARSKAKIVVDERERQVREKAADGFCDFYADDWVRIIFVVSSVQETVKCVCEG